MIYRLLADAVVVVHLLFIIFVIGGPLLVLRYRWLALLHLPALTWALLLTYFQWVCPLTPLEKWLMEKGGQSGYEEGFIAHYLLPVIYPRGISHEQFLWLGLLVAVINLGGYVLVIRQRHRH